MQQVSPGLVQPGISVGFGYYNYPNPQIHFLKYLFIWLHRVLAAMHWLFVPSQGLLSSGGVSSVVEVCGLM